MFVKKVCLNENYKNDLLPHVRKNSFFKSNKKYTTVFFKKLSLVVSYPARFLGSKTWSIAGLLVRMPKTIFLKNKRIFGAGYWFCSKPLVRNQAQAFHLPAIFSHAISESKGEVQNKWLAPTGFNILSPKNLNLDVSSLSKTLQVDDNRFFDPKSGLKVMLLEKDSEIFVVFGAAGSVEKEFSSPKEKAWKKLESKMKKQILLRDFLGSCPKIFKEALLLFSEIQKSPALASKKITLTGHCLGAALAAFIGIEKKIAAVGFNSMPFGAGAQHALGSKKLQRAGRYVTHISIKNDFYSDCPKITPLDRLINLIGFKTHGNFGRHYTLPAYPGCTQGFILSYQNQLRLHNDYLRSFKAFL